MLAQSPVAIHTLVARFGFAYTPTVFCLPSNNYVHLDFIALVHRLARIYPPPTGAFLLRTRRGGRDVEVLVAPSDRRPFGHRRPE